jgi:indolepyruvate ferredoxin oxidoreductase beta subunit
MGRGIASPLLSYGQADVIIAFEPGEAARAADYLAPEGIMILSDREVMPSSAVDSTYNPQETIASLRANFGLADEAPQNQQNATSEAHVCHCGLDPQSSNLTSRLHILDGEQIIAICGAKSLNVALLAYATSLGVFPFTSKELEEEVMARSGKYAEANAKALSYGKIK